MYIPPTVRISDMATLTGGQIFDYAKVEDHATVSGGAVLNYVTIRDYATVSGGQVCGYATVRDSAKVESGCRVYGESVIGGDAVISEGMTVCDMQVLQHDHIARIKTLYYSATVAPSVHNPKTVVIQWGCKRFTIKTLTAMSEGRCDYDWGGTFEEYKTRVLSEALRIEALLNK